MSTLAIYAACIASGFIGFGLGSRWADRKWERFVSEYYEHRCELSDE